MKTSVQINVERDANTIANEINLIKEQTQKFLLTSSIEIGKRLTEAKEVVGHGNWTEWLSKSVDYSQRTAQNLMKIYEEFGLKMLIDNPEKSNAKVIANLGYTQALAMLKLDFEEREVFLEEHDVENMTTKDLEAAIKEKNDILEEKKALEKRVNDLTKEQSERTLEISDQAEEIGTQNGKIRELEQKIEDIERINEELELAKGDAGTDAEQVKGLENDLKKAQSEIEKLQKELEKKPKEVEVEVEKKVEVVPEAVKKEVETLKTKLSASESTVKYKATLEVIVVLFNDLISSLNQMQATDPEQYEKFKTATNNFLDKLKQ